MDYLASFERHLKSGRNASAHTTRAYLGDVRAFLRFLAERYFLYAQGNDGTLFRGQVHHSPYPLREAQLVNIDETLLQAAKISPRSSPEHVLFSEGVNVEIFKLRAVTGF